MHRASVITPVLRKGDQFNNPLGAPSVRAALDNHGFRGVSSHHSHTYKLSYSRHPKCRWGSFAPQSAPLEEIPSHVIMLVQPIITFKLIRLTCDTSHTVGYSASLRYNSGQTELLSSWNYTKYFHNVEFQMPLSFVSYACES